MREVSARLLALRPVTSRRIEADQDSSHTVQYRLIAAEIPAVLPEFVVCNEIGQLDSAAFHALSSLILTELQKARSRLTALERWIDEMASQP